MIFDCHKSIKEKINFYPPRVKQKTELDIALGVDKNFMFGAAISITSVLMSNQDINIHFHLFTDYIDPDYIKRLKKLVLAYNSFITVYVMEADGIKKLPCSNAWSYATYFRLIAFEYLSEKIDLLLYIDADVICKGSLRELKNINLDNYFAAVTQDVDDCRKYAATRLNNSKFEDKYFNAGVIYANLKLWKKNHLLSAAFDMLMDKNKKFSFLDQDVLNIIFLDKVIFLPRIYNTIYGIKQELKNKDINKYKYYITDDTILIHYIGVTKPWHSWATYPSAQYFTRIYNKSFWSDIPLTGARTPKQFKKKSRHERLQGKRLASIKSYINYLIIKLKSS
ncbi:lipopolysaccharide 1,2-glucosyltransferase [Salmonella enterica subsp. enterica serovar Enteritidis]|nr:lipopolysaccharide 1,2-glucosyltransferase [Salmonella enterica subsp. enterica serovar Enteritidis]EGW9206058.1 lipopolysaccharide 1,2-glucosyltransferase [Salmonella enterica subsp. enterica serovar Enteritidis]